jgi:hypothetical protein
MICARITGEALEDACSRCGCLKRCLISELFMGMSIMYNRDIIGYIYINMIKHHAYVYIPISLFLIKYNSITYNRDIY